VNGESLFVVTRSCNVAAKLNKCFFFFRASIHSTWMVPETAFVGSSIGREMASLFFPHCCERKVRNFDKVLYSACIHVFIIILDSYNSLSAHANLFNILNYVDKQRQSQG
jgi:hypothetical protein